MFWQKMTLHFCVEAVFYLKTDRFKQERLQPVTRKHVKEESCRIGIGRKVQGGLTDALGWRRALFAKPWRWRLLHGRSNQATPQAEVPCIPLGCYPRGMHPTSACGTWQGRGYPTFFVILTSFSKLVKTVQFSDQLFIQS